MRVGVRFPGPRAPSRTRRWSLPSSSQGKTPHTDIARIASIPPSFVPSLSRVESRASFSFASNSKDYSGPEKSLPDIPTSSVCLDSTGIQASCRFCQEYQQEHSQLSPFEAIQAIMFPPPLVDDPQLTTPSTTLYAATAQNEPLPWPSSEESHAQHTPWSSKSTLYRTLTRMRSRSLPNSRRAATTSPEIIAGNIQVLPSSTTASMVPGGSSDLGATHGSTGMLSGPLSDSHAQTKTTSSSKERISQWVSSTIDSDSVLDPRPTPSSMDRHSGTSMATSASQGASNRLVNLALLTFCSFTVFVTFYTLVEMRDFFTVALGEIIALKTVTMDSHKPQATASMDDKLKMAASGYPQITFRLVSTWLEILIGIWLSITCGLFWIVVWQFCPDTVARLDQYVRGDQME
ncbi:unnamed protein product [Sympodiomycopsis kandeliae]